MEQRSGRIIRQGNQNPEVEIFRYVTEQTFDAYLYQLVENKQKFISQIMTSKSPVRIAEDIDEASLSYAEIKALATGNPLIKEKMDLDIAVSKLKLLKSNYLSQKYSLEDQIAKYYPAEIKRLENRLEGFEKDIACVENNTVLSKDDFKIIIGNTTYTEKSDAGKAIIEACKSMVSADETKFGEYCGFNMILRFDTLYKEYQVVLQNALSYVVSLGEDIYGNISRLDNAMTSIPSKKQACSEQLDNTRIQLENAKQQVEKPFSQEKELQEKISRLDELNILLNMDENENVKEKNLNLSPQQELNLAIKENNAAKVNEAIKSGANIHNSDDESPAPLFYAVECEADKAVGALLESGAYPDVRDNNENTPLHYANKKGNEKIEKLLVDYGADENLSSIKEAQTISLTKLKGRSR